MNTINAQPKSMWILSLIEIGMRFAFFGVANIIVLYLVNQVGMKEHHATHIFGLFVGLSFIFPIAGGYLADKWNYRDPIILGLCLVSISSFLLATEYRPLLLVSLLIMAIGVGLVSPCMYALLSQIYVGHAPMRAIGFSLYYAATQFGVFISLMCLGTLIHFDKWALAFVIAGIGPLLGFFALKYIIGHVSIFPIKLVKTKSKKELNSIEKDRLWVILTILFIGILFWMAVSQRAASMILFTHTQVDRQLMTFTIPTLWIVSSLFLVFVILSFPLASFYHKLREQGRAINPIGKMSLGFLSLGIAFALMVIGSTEIPYAKVYYVFGAYGVLALAELLVSPIALSTLTNLAPHHLAAFFTGLWYFVQGLGFYLGGVVAGFPRFIPYREFFECFAIGGIAIAIILFLLMNKLNRMRHADLIKEPK